MHKSEKQFIRAAPSTTRRPKTQFLSVIVSVILVLTGIAGRAVAQPSTNGLLLWLDSSCPGSIVTNVAGRVTAWLNTAPGATNAVTYTGQNDNNTSASYNSSAPTYVMGSNGFKVVNFNGGGYLDNLNFTTNKPLSMTVFLLASAATNLGAYSGFMALRQSQTSRDWQTGLNIDQGKTASTTFDRLNVEGAKAGGNGGFQFADGSLNFGSFYLFEVDYGGGPATSNSLITVVVQGVSMSVLAGSNSAVNLNECFIGTRAPFSGDSLSSSNHNLIGQIAAVLAYDHHLASTDLTQTENYLKGFFASPSLSIGGGLVSWPNRGDYRLQSNSHLDTTNWVYFGGTIITNSHGSNTATVTATSGSLFFRLSYP